MSSTRHLYLLVTLLILCSLGLFFYKVQVLHWPVQPAEQSNVWAVEARLSFTGAPSRPIKVSFLVPPAQVNFAKLDENFVSLNYGISTNEREDGNRESIWTIRRAPGEQTLYYRLLVSPQAAKDAHEAALPTTTSVNELDAMNEIERQASELILEQVRAQSYDSTTFAVGVIKTLLDVNNSNASLLLKKDRSPTSVIKAATDILSGAHIPARNVHGLLLSMEEGTQPDIRLHHMLAVWNGSDKWVYINPTTANIGLPKQFLIWSYGNDNAMIAVDGGKQANVEFSARNTFQDILDITRAQEMQTDDGGLGLWDFSLFSLPIQAQHAYQVLIMIPLGAFVILLLRNIVGIKTFGTFMPVLIALAFRETALLPGIILFIMIIALGLAIRFYLEHLKLLVFARVAAVLSVVVLIMLGLSVISHRLGFEHGLAITLFPMVILTMTIERMSIVWEERNAWDAIVQAGGSLLSASVAYMVMNNVYAEHLIFVFPELLLIIIAFMLLMGRYRGYRLSELFRFQSLLGKK